MKGEVVGSGDEFVERDQLDAGFARNSRGDKRIAAENVETESTRTPGHFKADAAEPENAESLAAQFRALQILLVPFAGMHRRVCSGHLARESEHETNGQLGNGDRIRTGRVHDNDAAARGCFGVDVVNANTGAANDTQLGRFLHEGVVCLHG